MVHRTAFATCVTLAALMALAETAPARADAPARDPHSQSRPDEVRVTHADIDWTVDFERRELRGAVAWSFERVAPSAESLVFDTRGLAIESVEGARGDARRFDLAYEHPLLGRALVVHLEPDDQRITIRYRTGPESAALQWLDPAQTAEKTQPFLFSQAQAILARTMLPCQDSPAVRITYSANVRVPRGLVAVMAARSAGAPSLAAAGPGDAAPDARDTIYRFEMPQPIPSYLIAIAVGDIAFAPLGPRTGVYAEPSVLDRAAYEFADTEKMLESAEALFGPYRWERYDIIVLPPSFPYGGMENPRLTFATPTVLAGDRSLVALIAHELAHSWSGNLVTNATWADFWLNEGFTVYFERRIIEAVYGVERAEMEALLGWEDLHKELKQLAPDDTRLVQRSIARKDPDEGITSIAYEKGCLFLRLIEEAVGRERFDPFLRRWFDTNAFTSRTSAEFERVLRRELFAGQAARTRALGVSGWLYEPGLPDNAPRARSAALDAAADAARAFAAGRTRAAALPARGWTTHEWLQFLHALPPKLTVAQLRELDAAWALTNTTNNEILAHWLEISLRGGYAEIDAALARFLTTQGRRKFLEPLYKELVETSHGKRRAGEIYAEARPLYHPISRATVDEILGWTERAAN
ncbi:MAG: M1 family metallopeptidase [bacterium]